MWGWIPVLLSSNAIKFKNEQWLNAWEWDLSFPPFTMEKWTCVLCFRSHDRLRTRHILKPAGGKLPGLTFGVAAHYKPNCQPRQELFIQQHIICQLEILYRQYLLLFTSTQVHIRSRMIAIHYTIWIQCLNKDSSCNKHSFCLLVFPPACAEKEVVKWNHNITFGQPMGSKTCHDLVYMCFKSKTPLPTCHWEHMAA